MESTNPETVVANQDHNRNPVFSPDGRWVIYLAWRGSAAQAKTGRLMRMPAGGGSPELILETRGLPGFVTSGHVLVPTTAGHPAFRCPTRPGASCVLSEAKDREVVFSSFDPAPSAAKAEIFRIEVNNPNNLFWDLSPDGSRIAYGERSLRSLIQVRELRQGKTRDVSMANWPELLTLGWSADGKSLFATNFEPTASLLLRITLDGKVIVLYKAAKEVEAPRASPDGRYLAFGEVISSSNVWLIERIPL